MGTCGRVGLPSALLLAIAAGSSRGEDHPARTVEPDFYLVYVACRLNGSTFGNASPDDDGFVEMKLQGMVTGCETSIKKRLTCTTTFADSAKPVQYDMRITTETNEMIVLETDNGGDFVAIRADTNRVISTSRLHSSKMLGTKTCHGYRLTPDEYKVLQKRQRKRDPGNTEQAPKR
jgi:hypothetical protein